MRNGMRKVRHPKRQGLFPLPTLTPFSLPTLSLPLLPFPTHSRSTDSATDSTASSTSTSSSTQPTTTTSVHETTSNGVLHTITEYANAASSVAPTPTPSTTPVVAQGFLQNKPLSGTVFALLGLIGFFTILSIVTFSIRRSRNNRLVREAISFDPAAAMDPDHFYGDEKSREAFGRRSPSIRSKDDYGYYHGPSPGVMAYEPPHLPNGGAALQLPARAFGSPSNDTYSVRSGSTNRPSGRSPYITQLPSPGNQAYA